MTNEQFIAGKVNAYLREETKAALETGDMDKFKRTAAAIEANVKWGIGHWIWVDGMPTPLHPKKKLSN